MSGKKPKRCPFCGCELVYQEHKAPHLTGRPRMRYWLHPKTGCFADGFEIMPDEVAAWNEGRESVLNLPTKGCWFDKIDRMEKLEEYREIKDYWTKRFITAGLLNADGTPTGKMAEITLTRGYGKNAPQLAARVMLSVGQGRPEWGAEPGKDYYRLYIMKTRRIQSR